MIATAIIALGYLVAFAWSAIAVRSIAQAKGPWYQFVDAAPPGVDVPGSPTVEAIVPARDEEARLASTVEAIRRQDYPNLAITLVDDESTDATLMIARRLEAESRPGVAPLLVVEGTTRPPGWVGKTWAVHQASRAATSEWLWFVDADMGLDPRALSTALVEADRTGADLVSLLPGVRCETFWQRTIAMALLHILAQVFPLRRVNNPALPDALAAGGFLLIRRSTYERIGGHEAVKHSIVEDLDLARTTKRLGGRLAIRLAPRLAWTHLYGSFHDIWVGLRKNAYAGMDYQPHKFVVGATVALILAWTPLTAVGLGITRGSVAMVAVGAWGVVTQVLATVPNLVFLRVPWVHALSLPLGITAYVAIAASSAWHYHRGRVLWKGRAIDAATASVSTGPTAVRVESPKT